MNSTGGGPENEKEFPCACGYTFAERWERESHWENDAGDGLAHGIPTSQKEDRHVKTLTAEVTESKLLPQPEAPYELRVTWLQSPGQVTSIGELTLDDLYAIRNAVTDALVLLGKEQ